MAVSFAVNWVGVIVGNVALLVIGFVWFMPNVFGNRWIALMGRPGEQLRPGPDFILSVLSGTLNAFVMPVLALNLKATTAADGGMLGRARCLAAWGCAGEGAAARLWSSFAEKVAGGYWRPTSLPWRLRVGGSWGIGKNPFRSFPKVSLAGS